MWRTIGILAVCLGIAPASGCGGASGVDARGQVVKGGAPVKLNNGEVVTITVTNGKDTFTSNSFPDGNFSVQKPAGGPIPEGKYKVSFVHQKAPDPYARKPGFRKARNLPGEWNLTTANASLKVDIGVK